MKVILTGDPALPGHTYQGPDPALFPSPYVTAEPVFQEPLGREMLDLLSGFQNLIDISLLFGESIAASTPLGAVAFMVWVLSRRLQGKPLFKR